jgi:hypothetical protein
MAERNVSVAYQVMEFLCVSLRVCDTLEYKVLLDGE